MNDKPIDSWRARAAVSEALDVFNSSYMQEVWTKALARREADPEGAVTSARGLLESVCKHILDEAGKEYNAGLPLPKLYLLAAGVLDIAPTEPTEPIFKALFQSCSEIIESIGRLRNHLSDAHGHGPFGTMPDWRHAELAVTLSGAMATYLAAVWKGRQPTVGDVIRTLLAKTDATKPLAPGIRWALEKLARSPIAEIIASKLQISDVVAHGEARRAAGILPQTVMQDIVYLRLALGDLSAYVLDKATIALRAMKLIGKSVPRERRPTHDEYDALVSYYRGPRKSRKKDLIPMAEIMEFAVWSGRPVDQICSLRWSDVDFDRKTCKLPGDSEEFPLFDKAWAVVKSRPRINAADADERIFPFNSRSVIQAHVYAKKRIEEHVGKNLRFQDLRYEAISRLLEKGHQPHEVAKATGVDIKKVMQSYEKLRAQSVPA
jgi:integrase